MTPPPPTTSVLTHTHNHDGPRTAHATRAPHTAAPARTPAPDESRTICNAGGVYALRRLAESGPLSCSFKLPPNVSSK